MTRLLAAVTSQPARMRRVTGTCAAHRAAVGEGFSAQSSPDKPSEGDGLLSLARARVCVSWSPPRASL